MDRQQIPIEPDRSGNSAEFNRLTSPSSFEQQLKEINRCYFRLNDKDKNPNDPQPVRPNSTEIEVCRRILTTFTSCMLEYAEHHNAECPALACSEADFIVPFNEARVFQQGSLKRFALLLHIQNSPQGFVLFSAREVNFLLGGFQYTAGPVAIRLLDRPGDNQSFQYNVLYSAPAFHQELDYVDQQGTALLYDNHITSNLLCRCLNKMQEELQTSITLEAGEIYDISVNRHSNDPILTIVSEHGTFSFKLHHCEEFGTVDIQLISKSASDQQALIEEDFNRQASLSLAESRLPSRRFLLNSRFNGRESLPAASLHFRDSYFSLNCDSESIPHPPRNGFEQGAIDDLFAQFDNRLFAANTFYPASLQIERMIRSFPLVTPDGSGYRYSGLVETTNLYGNSVIITDRGRREYQSGRAALRIWNRKPADRLRYDLFLDEAAYQDELNNYNNPNTSLFRIRQLAFPLLESAVSSLQPTGNSPSPDQIAQVSETKIFRRSGGETLHFKFDNSWYSFELHHNPETLVVELRRSTAFHS